MKIILTLFLSLVLLNGTPSRCEDGQKYKATGVIIGPDMRMCPCCGGYLINLNSRSVKFSADSTFHFTEFPETLDLKNTTEFPVFVRLDYENTAEFCGKGIKLTRAEKIKE